jgi:superfamily II DNA or RNA helicase
MTQQDYAKFLASKTLRAKERGLERVPELAPHLFPFQRSSVDFSLRAGCAALFLDTGLGKTECQLEWCQRAIEATNDRALILTPLAVAGQTRRRAERWGYEARVIREQSEARSGINICNYDRIDKLDPSEFGIVALDEASILKSFTGITTRKLIESFKGARFKLAATATPAPNDYMELGQYCEFLDVMRSSEMLMRWFIADQSEMGRYRLKGHAVTPFWDWMASFARMGEKPSDITGNVVEDAGFILPPFQLVRHVADSSEIDRDFADLFGAPAMSATSLHKVKRQTREQRASSVATAVEAEPDEAWLIWCDTNYEADELKEKCGGIEIRGSMPIEKKEELLDAFSTGQEKRLIAKPSMCGLGLDWSHCARMAFVGRSYSYETWYQAVRRCWRFGQKREVVVHLVTAEGEDTIGRVIDRKAGDHADMKAAMRLAMRRSGQSSQVKVAYHPTHIARLPSWICAA